MDMKKIIFTIGLSWAACLVQAQQTYNFGFANKFGRSNRSEVPKDFAVDGTQNCYIVGEFADSVDFNPGAATNFFTTSTGDFYLNKLTSTGAYAYTKIFKRSAINGGIRGVTTDGQGNIYVTGCFFTGTIDCNPAAAVVNLTASSTTSPVQTSENFFIIKLNALGNFVWGKQLKGVLQSAALADRPMDIKVNKFGDVLVSSTFRSTIDFDPGTATFNMTPATSATGMFVCKLNSSGNFVWAKQVSNTTGTPSSPNMAIDTASNIVLTGNFTGTLDFNPGTATNNLTALAKNKYYLTKWNNAGNFVWALNAGGVDVRTDIPGNIYYGGSFRDTIDLNPSSAVNNFISFGQSDVFLAKLNSAGTYIFGKQFGGASRDSIRSIGFDSLRNNLFLNMTFVGTSDFDPSSCIRNSVSFGGSDICIAKVDLGGNYLWAGQYGSKSNDEAVEMGISANSQSLYFTGGIIDTTDFNPNGVTKLNSTGLSDVFTCKSIQCTSACPVFPACIPDAKLLSAVEATNVSELEKTIIYPNPNKGSFNLQFKDNAKNSSVRIVDLTGKVIAQYQFESVTNTSIELQAPTGFYWVEIVSGDQKMERIKMIIQ
jgi:hypothetical protein